jgi:hypothetical protein
VTGDAVVVSEHPLRLRDTERGGLGVEHAGRGRG